MTRVTAIAARTTRTSAIAAYAAPGVPEAMLLYCASLVIPGFYATEMGLSTGQVEVSAGAIDKLLLRPL